MRPDALRGLLGLPMLPSVGAGGSERADLALDLDGVLAALPAELRDLAVRLREQTVSQAARAMNVPRTTLLRQVERLRQCCEDASLRIDL